MLRREQLYSNQLSQWRREFAEQGVAGLAKSAAGPAVKKTLEQKCIEHLEEENLRLRKQIELKDGCLMFQKSLGAAGESRRDRLMSLLQAGPPPESISERAACHVLNLCRNSLPAASARNQFCGPPIRLSASGAK